MKLSFLSYYFLKKFLFFKCLKVAKYALTVKKEWDLSNVWDRNFEQRNVDNVLSGMGIQEESEISCKAGLGGKKEIWVGVGMATAKIFFFSI